MKLTFASMKRLFRKELEPEKVIDLSAERAKRWLAKHTRPIPQKDPPEAA